MFLNAIPDTQLKQLGIRIWHLFPVPMVRLFYNEHNQSVLMKTLNELFSIRYWKGYKDNTKKKVITLFRKMCNELEGTNQITSAQWQDCMAQLTNVNFEALGNNNEYHLAYSAMNNVPDNFDEMSDASSVSWTNADETIMIGNEEDEDEDEAGSSLLIHTKNELEEFFEMHSLRVLSILDRLLDGREKHERLIDIEDQLMEIEENTLKCVMIQKVLRAKTV